MPFIIISIIGIFGLESTVILITLNVNSSYFYVYAFIVQYLVNHQDQPTKNKNSNNNHETLKASNEDEVIILGRHWTRSYYWIPEHVFDINIDFKKIDRVEDISIPEATDKILLVVDSQLRGSLSDKHMPVLQKHYYNYTITPITTFKDKTIKYDTSKYPYASMSENRDTRWVQIRGFNLS